MFNHHQLFFQLNSNSNFKTDRYLNNFQEQFFGTLRLRKYQTSLQNFFSM